MTYTMSNATLLSTHLQCISVTTGIGVSTGVYFLFVLILCIVSLAITIVIVYLHSRATAVLPSPLPTMVCEIGSYSSSSSAASSLSVTDVFINKLFAKRIHLMYVICYLNLLMLNLCVKRGNILYGFCRVLFVWSLSFSSVHFLYIFHALRGTPGKCFFHSSRCG